MGATFLVDPEDAGKRLDHFLQHRLPEFSRSRLQDWIKQGLATVNGAPQKPSFTLRGGEQISFSPGALPPLRAVAEEIPLDILYVDDDVVVVDKPAGVVVHAGAGRHSGTLVNALLHHFGQLSAVAGEERPGIVHRLDRDTSGVIVVARTDAAHRELSRQFAAREVSKIYLALVQGQIAAASGVIKSPISRDPVRRIRMTSRLATGRSALTEYHVIERLDRFTYLEVKIGTGRTHQIRVHLSSIGYPVAGDTLYGARPASYGRFFLHAHRLQFRSPSRGDMITVESSLPPVLRDWLTEARSLGGLPAVKTL